MSGPTVDPLREAALLRPDDRALEDEDRSWTYAQLDAAADLMAGRLVAGGVRSGGRVALLLPNRSEAVIAVHAAPRAGAAVAPLHPSLTEPELRRSFAVLAPALVLCDRRTERVALALSRSRIGHRPVLSADPGGQALSLADVDPAPASHGPPSADRTVAVLWTSGTGGTPRGVEISARNLVASAQAARSRLGLKHTDGWYASLQIAHVGGLALVYRAAVVGCRVVTRERFSVDDFRALLASGRITHASVVPTMLRRIVDAEPQAPAPAALRCILVGGDAAPPALLERAVELGYPVALTYGLTEASSQVATAPPALVRQKPGCVGPPLDGVEIRVAASGEILVRGATLAKKYAERSAVLTDEDGWHHTGDLGRLDEDGHLWVTGRLAERIVSGGVTVDPREVEELLRLHPGVEDVAVVGLPDPEWGERVAAAVVPRLGEGPTADALLDFAVERLSPSKRPREVVLVGALPRNANGKVDRTGVEELFAGKPKLR